MMNNWIKKNAYYMQNGEYTICKTGISQVRYGLWHGSINRGWFDTSAEAIAKWKELTG
jgi:hypothetical protein